MLKIPESIMAGFSSFLSKRNVPVTSHNYYKKWLRYYLDYCYKYRFYSLSPGSLPSFLNKLKEKKQIGVQQKQAHEAIRLFYELVSQEPNIKRVLASIEQQNHGVKDIGNSCNNNKKPEINKGETNCNWQKIYLGLDNEIKVRHYSPKTLKSYAIWVRKFQYFTKSKNQEALSTSDVKEFLTFLAVEQKASASSQNQAFNALLFFFRNILKKDFGEIDGVVRAKKKPRTQIRGSQE